MPRGSALPDGAYCHESRLKGSDVDTPMIHEVHFNKRSKTRLQTSQRFLRVNYHRWDGNYRDASLWTWDESHRRNPETPEMLAAGESRFGVYFIVEVGRYGEGAREAQGIGMVPRIRRSWEFKDGNDRIWSPDMGYEVWLLQDDDEVYSEPPDISPAIKAAWLDDWDTVRLLLSRIVEVSALDQRHYRAVRNNAETIHAERVTPLSVVRGRTRLLEVKLERALKSLAGRVVMQADCFRSAPVRAGTLQYRADLFGTCDELGALYTKDSTTFRVFSPQAVEVAVGIRDADEERHEPSRVVMLRNRGRGVWEGKERRDLEGSCYSLRVRTQWGHDSGWVTDPYAKNTIGSERWSLITAPLGRAVRRPGLPESLVDAVVAEISVRDMTIHESSGVVAGGKYAGLAESTTSMPQDESVRTGLAHLQELGVTHVQLMPCQDFDNNEEDPEYNWGYMTAFFNSPEGWYATKVNGRERVTEFRAMVDAFHEAGIGVIMDVVYNHTGLQNTFERVTPEYYLRRNIEGKVWNGSGTGNEVKSEALMARRFIIDSCRYWMTEFGIDGFRFDLMGLMDFETLCAIRDELREIEPRVLLYGEPWIAAQCGLPHPTDKNRVAGSGIAAFNDHFRNAVKGEPDGVWGGYAQNGSRRWETMRGIAGSVDDWASSPEDSINYLACHDNLTLWDKIALSSGEPEEERIRMQCLAMAILMISQGGIVLHGGCEFLRTKSGNHNSYDSGDEINAVDWDFKRRHMDVFNYVQGLIAIRRQHPVFRLRKAEDVRKRLAFFDSGNSTCIAFTLDGRDLANESWARCAVLINPQEGDMEFSPPFSGGRFFAFDLEASPAALRLEKANETVLVPRRSLAIIASHK